MVQLEDEIEDILGKALRGHGRGSIDPKARAGDITGAESLADVPESTRTLIAELGLSGEALVGLSSYNPTVALPSWIQQCITPFGHLGVNSWVITGPDGAVLFDAGSDGEDLENQLNGVETQNLVITHSHPDHVDGAEALRDRVDHIYSPCDLPFKHLAVGESIQLAGLFWTVLDASGHCTPALAYFTSDTAVPVCVVGDLLFAGSIGGCVDPAAHQRALQSLETSVLTLPPETILLSGHGPATTLEQELKGNAFLSALQS